MGDEYNAAPGEVLPGEAQPLDSQENPLASPSKPLASEEMEPEAYEDVEYDILLLAAKKCWSNYHAWKSLLDKGAGSDETNSRGMAAWKHKALLIEARLNELQQRA